MAKNTRPIRMTPGFEKFLKDIRIERLKKTINPDKEPLSLPRLGDALTRVPKLKDIMINSPIIDDK